MSEKLVDIQDVVAKSGVVVKRRPRPSEALPMVDAYIMSRPRRPRRLRRKVKVGAMLRLCPGGRHAWFDSNVGPVRKPVEVKP